MYNQATLSSEGKTMDIRSEFPTHPGPPPEEGAPRTRSNAIVCMVVMSLLFLLVAFALVIAFAASFLVGALAAVVLGPVMWQLGRLIHLYGKWLTWWHKFHAFNAETRVDPKFIEYCRTQAKAR
jgi:hypothetical protein